MRASFFVHEIPWTFTSSKFIDIFFYMTACLGLTKQSGLKLTYLSSLYSTRASSVQQLLGMCSDGINV